MLGLPKSIFGKIGLIPSKRQPQAKYPPQRGVTFLQQPTGRGVVSLSPDLRGIKQSEDTGKYKVTGEGHSIYLMSPYKFLALAPQIPEPDHLLHRGVPLEKSIEKEGMKEMPFLSYDTANGEIVAHEGRHRAFAAIKLGKKMIPVRISDTRRYQHPHFVFDSSNVRRETHTDSQLQEIRNLNNVEEERIRTKIIPMRITKNLTARLRRAEDHIEKVYSPLTSLGPDRVEKAKERSYIVTHLKKDLQRQKDEGSRSFEASMVYRDYETAQATALSNASRVRKPEYASDTREIYAPGKGRFPVSTNFGPLNPEKVKSSDLPPTGLNRYVRYGDPVELQGYRKIRLPRRELIDEPIRSPLISKPQNPGKITVSGNYVGSEKELDETAGQVAKSLGPRVQYDWSTGIPLVRKYVSTKDIVPYESKERGYTKDEEKIKKYMEMQRYGDMDPIAVRTLKGEPSGAKYEIYQGHHRFEAATRLGKDSILTDINDGSIPLAAGRQIELAGGRTLRQLNMPLYERGSASDKREKDKLAPKDISELVDTAPEEVDEIDLQDQTPIVVGTPKVPYKSLLKPEAPAMSDEEILAELDTTVSASAPDWGAPPSDAGTAAVVETPPPPPDDATETELRSELAREQQVDRSKEEADRAIASRDSEARTSVLTHGARGLRVG